MRYQILIRLLLPLFFAAIWWRGRREPAWRQGWAQRLGRLAARADRPVWIHAASVGEANSAAGFFAQLRRECPDLPIHLSAFTPTGAERLAALLPDATISVLPVDIPAVWQRFLGALNPRVLVVLETECWPNLLMACEARAVPVLWLSGRLSDKSVRSYRKIFGAAGLARALASVQAFGLQTEADRQRYAVLGAPSERMQVTGSLKLDMPTQDAALAAGLAWRSSVGSRPCWIAASTHAGEEAAALQAHALLRATHPQALLILAPRHPRRVPEVEALLREQSWTWVTRSSGTSCGDAAVFLVDTLGELMQFYAAADIAFVGGSLVPIGGHNLLEPAVLGRPVLCGPHVESCRDIAQGLQDAGGLAQIDNAGHLGARLIALLAQQEERAKMGQAGASYVTRNRGAVEKSLQLLRPYL